MKFSALIPVALGFFGAATKAQSTCKTPSFMLSAVSADGLGTNFNMLSYDNGKIYIGYIKESSYTSEILTLTTPRTDGWTSFLSYHSETYQDLTINPTNVTEVTFWNGNSDPPTGYTRSGFSLDSDNYLTYGGDSKWYACLDASLSAFFSKTYTLWYMGGEYDAATSTPANCTSIKLAALPYGVLSS
ncbi:hypothetical protein RUND412_008021 [Rhizina undulata]